MATIDLIRQTNHALRESLPTGAYFVDLEQVSGTIGRHQFYDRRRYFWTKQPFSDEGVVRLGEHVFSGLRATLTGPKKVLVLDLDNTLWGGVVGECGARGIELGDTPGGEAFRDFQKLAKALANRGVLIAICSKNNPEDAREPFESNPGMVLQYDDIAVFEAGWRPKSEVIRDMAETLHLGLDSFVFFDDEAAEREFVRQALPEVEVVEVPDDPAEYRQALLEGLWFESVGISAEDRARTRQYLAEQRRVKSEPAAGCLDEYLRSLEITAEVGDIGQATIERVVQLIGKTNQFNLTTRRHTVDAVVELLAPDGAVGLTLNVCDRFGDYGLVGVIIAVVEPSGDLHRLRIDTWLMGCRVIGRTAEQFFFNALVDRVKQLGCDALIGEYIPTKKNGVVADLYERLGFRLIEDGSSTSCRYLLDIDDYSAVTTFVAGTTRE